MTEDYYLRKIKKLKKRIDALEARLDALESTYWISTTPPTPLPDFSPHAAWRDVVADYEKSSAWGEEYYDIGHNRYL